jgi:hypothetical protein
MEKSLENGLKFSPQNIYSLGKHDIVMVDNLVQDLKEISKKVESEDVFVLYFSGHGYSKGDDHYLVFSDSIISTQQIIEYIQLIKAKTKIIFIDSCFSGNFKVSGCSSLKVNETLDEFQSKGIAVFSSSNSNQTSHGHPDKPISVFTNFLCTAMQSNLLKRKGYVTLYEIVKFVSLYLEFWNKANPLKKQNPIFRGNIGGTVHFKVGVYKPYQPKTIYEEYNDYIIYNIEPYHHALAKRLSVEILLKEPMTLGDICDISKSIIKRVKNVEVHQNKIAERYFTGKPANIIWCYFASDEDDIKHSNFLCHTTWVDDSQDKKHWYMINDKTSFMLNDIHFDIHSFYDTLKKIYLEQSGTTESVLKQIKEILACMVSSAEQIIKHYNAYLNNDFNEDELYKQLESIIPKLDEYYEQSGNIDFPPKEIGEFDQECQNLFATIHNLTLFYNKRYTVKRSVDNRKACMNMTIKDYYRELHKVRELEESLSL